MLLISHLNITMTVVELGIRRLFRLNTWSTKKSLIRQINNHDRLLAKMGN